VNIILATFCATALRSATLPFALIDAAKCRTKDVPNAKRQLTGGVTLLLPECDRPGGVLIPVEGLS